jgi:hypothetical protein
MQNKLRLFLVLTLLGGVVMVRVCSPQAAFAEETITITTYYPSPYGSYNELETRTLWFGNEKDGKVAFKYPPDATYNRRLRITAGKEDTGDNSQGASIDLHGNDYPTVEQRGRLDLVAGKNEGNIIFFTGNPVNERMRITKDGNVSIGTDKATSKLVVRGLPEYSDDAAACAGGLKEGAFYRTNNNVKVVSEEFIYFIRLNQQSGAGCEYVCISNGGTCVSAGTDNDATNGRYWSAPYGTCYEPALGIGCNFLMLPQGIICGGKNAQWTNCRCRKSCK